MTRTRRRACLRASPAKIAAGLRVRRARVVSRGVSSAPVATAVVSAVPKRTPRPLGSLDGEIRRVLPNEWHDGGPRTVHVVDWVRGGTRHHVPMVFRHPGFRLTRWRSARHDG